jgi:hypothetical protein
MFASAVDYEDDTARAEQYYDREKYVMWGFSAHDEMLALPADAAALSGRDGGTARELTINHSRSLTLSSQSRDR